eukprot:Lithocolla_globosa_v1_NODE_8261_length_840_cov_21.895939.p1 type:complete len:182 gc:universal NODE_8261_length_840_cov_21.895939:791-246(-)
MAGPVKKLVFGKGSSWASHTPYWPELTPSVMSNFIKIYPSLTQKQRVRRLYRNCLKASLDWDVDRPVWRVNAIKIRQEFEAKKDETDFREIERLLKQADEFMKVWTHPEGYIHPCAPGGTKFQRNTPLPKHIMENGFGNFDREYFEEYEAQMNARKLIKLKELQRLQIEAAEAIEPPKAQV